MNTDEFISIADFCRYHNIETSFIESLEDAGLIHISLEQGPGRISFDELPRVEKFVRMHYDLDINLAGLETVDYLLQKIASLKKQLNHIHGMIQDDDSDFG